MKTIGLLGGMSWEVHYYYRLINEALNSGLVGFTLHKCCYIASIFMKRRVPASR